MNMSAAVAEVFNLPEPEEELYIIHSADADACWAWGYSEEQARAAALHRVQDLDACEPPGDQELPADAFVDTLCALRIRLPHSQVLDLLHLLGLTDHGGSS